MPQRPDDLEVLVPLGEEGQEEPGAGSPPATPARRVSRKQWLVVAVVAGVVVAAVAVAGAGRDALTRREVGWLDRQWHAVNEDDLARFTAEQQLDAYVAVDPGMAVPAALAALYREEAADLLAARSQLSGAILVDGGLSHLRGQMVTAVGDEAALLTTWAADYQAEKGVYAPVDTTTRFEGIEILDRQVETRLSTERGHWRVRAAPSPAAPGYRSEQRALAQLSPWLDQPTGTVLLSTSAADGTLVRLDVDASTATPTGASPDGLLVARAGYLAYPNNGGQVMAVGSDASGPVRVLVPGDWVFAATDPADVWVADGPDAEVSEVDGSGRRLAGPYDPPGNAFAATSTGLVIGLEPGLEVWEPLTGKVSCRMSTAGLWQRLDASGDLLAWVGTDFTLHVTDFGSCRDLFSEPVSDRNSTPAASFSPDGQKIAISQEVQTPDGVRSVMTLVALASSGASASGRVVDVPGPPPLTAALARPVDAIAWSADGQRLWWLCSFADPSPSAYILTWHVGDDAAQILHTVNLHLDGPLLVATS